MQQNGQHNFDEDVPLRVILREIQKDQTTLNTKFESFMSETNVHRGYQKELLTKHDKDIDKLKKHNTIKEVLMWISAITGIGGGAGSLLK